MLSVIFGVNRTNPYLKAAINSVLEQTHKNFELLICANACTDDFFEELQEYTADSRIKLFRTQLPQFSFTLNYLIEQAAGELLVRMDADDISEPHRFERLLAAANESNADVIGSWATLIDENDRVVGHLSPPSDAQGVRRYLLRSSPLIHPTVAFRKKFWIESRGYLGGFVSEDFDLWLRAISRGATIINIPEYLFRYRMHSAQASRSRLGYAETAAYWYRELLAAPSFYNAAGWMISTVKAIAMPLRNRFKKGSAR